MMKNRIKSSYETAAACEILENLYHAYNERNYVTPDPLQYLYRYRSIRDREIAGLIASSLAYGKVNLICKCVESILDVVGKPSEYLLKSTHRSILRDFKGFRYRFTNGHDIALLLTGTKRIINEFGSIEQCMMNGMDSHSETVIPAISYFVDAHAKSIGEKVHYLLPSPSNGSACKRLNLYLKWMVRKDNVDPGGWKKIKPSKLIVPVDTHINRICRNLGMLQRKSANMQSALEITEAFRQYAPDDPTRYDFALTRMGMWDREVLHELYSKFGVSIFGNCS